MKSKLSIILLGLSIQFFGSFTQTCYDIFNDAVYAANRVYVQDMEYCSGLTIVNPGYCKYEAGLVFGISIDKASNDYYKCLGID